MTRLSVNINKIATLRNARGGNRPDVIEAALDCERFGAQGITVHPRPDERHIRYADVVALKKVITTELNVEGNPDRRLMDLISETRPAQVTLVPDSPTALTSNAGWDTVQNELYLETVVRMIKNLGCRVSIFVDPDLAMIEGAARVGADRIELFTESYALQFPHDPQAAIAPFISAAKKAKSLGLGLNAGHDLDLENLAFLVEQIPSIDEVSIGHALICDALYLGLEETVGRYRAKLS